MIGLLYQLCVVAYIMEKTSVSQRIRRYVDVISTRLHDLKRRWPFYKQYVDNSNLERIPLVTMKDIKRQDKYNKKLKKLMEK